MVIPRRSHVLLLAALTAIVPSGALALQSLHGVGPSLPLAATGAMQRLSREAHLLSAVRTHGDAREGRLLVTGSPLMLLYFEFNGIDETITPISMQFNIVSASRLSVSSGWAAIDGERVEFPPDFFGVWTLRHYPPKPDLIGWFPASHLDTDVPLERPEQVAFVRRLIAASKASIHLVNRDGADLVIHLPDEDRAGHRNVIRLYEVLSGRPWR